MSTPATPLGQMLVPSHPTSSSWQRRRSGLCLPPGAGPEPRPIAVDLFAGAGGFSLGFHQAGWHVAAAIEFDLDATATYLVNLGDPDTVLHTGPGMSTGTKGVTTTSWTHERCSQVLSVAGTGWIAGRGRRDVDEDASDYARDISPPIPADEPAVEHFFRADVRDVTGAMILDALGLETGQVGAVIGGPPCQGFSISGRRDVMDPRNSLVFEFARLVCEIQPRTFVMENVPGITTMRTPEGIPVLDALAMALDDGGYGQYEALRRALGATAAHAVSRRAVAKTSGKRGEPPAVGAAQPTLFDDPTGLEL